MKLEKGCSKCPGCLSKKGCFEYYRLCVRLDRAAKNFHTSSIATDTLSHFDLAVHDLSKYQALVEQVKEAAIQIDLDVDSFPADHLYKKKSQVQPSKVRRGRAKQRVASLSSGGSYGDAPGTSSPSE